MEPKFVNKYAQTKSVLRELFSSISGKASWAIFTVMLITTMFCGIVSITLSDDKMTGIYLLLLALFIAFFRLGLPIVMANQTLKKNELISNSKEPITIEITFYETNLQTFFAATNEKLDITYDKIKKLIVTENLYILSFEGRVYITVSRSGFTVGKAEEFEAFIKEKIKK